MTDLHATIVTTKHIIFTSYRKADLENHIEAIHVKTSGYLCTRCNYSISSRRKILQHVRVNHKADYTPGILLLTNLIPLINNSKQFTIALEIYLKN